MSKKSNTPPSNPRGPLTEDRGLETAKNPPKTPPAKPPKSTSKEKKS